MSFGKRLKEARKLKGLSQEKLAAVAGVSRVAITQWEKDQTGKVNTFAFLKAVRYLGVDPYDIALGSKSANKHSYVDGNKRLSRLVEIWPMLTDDAQKDILERAEELAFSTNDTLPPPLKITSSSTKQKPKSSPRK